MNDPLLKITNLALSYGRQDAFRDVNLSLYRGEITALVGPSGCGKTSLLRCLNRMTDLLKECRLQGQIELQGRDIYSPGQDLIQLRKRVGMIFQKPNPFPLSIHKNLSLPLREHGWKNRQDIDGIIERRLQDVGLWKEVRDRLHTSAMALSGGQKQRLCIARALVLEPEILLMDEPCSALDPLSSGLVEDLIAGLRGDYTVLIVTHNLAQARRISDKTAFFWVRDGAGALIEIGPTRELFASPKEELTRAYIEGARG